jgi:hypothetical protein
MLKNFFAETEKPYGPKGLLHEIFKNRIRFGRDIRLLNISAYAQPAMKSIPRMLSMDLHVKTVCDEIVSSYAQCAIKSSPRMLSMCMLEFSKSKIKMQISTKKHQNFEKPFRNPYNRTNMNFLKNKNISKKIWFRVCSVTEKMFELRNSDENRRKRSNKFFENLPREYKDLI